MCILSETDMKTKNIKKMEKKSRAEAILKQIGGLPYFSVETIKSSGMAGEYANITLHRLVKNGKIAPLKRGMYVSQRYLNTVEKTGSMDDYLEFLVSALYSPSYLSGEYILSERGILAEAVYSFTSITKNKTKRFFNRLGNFHYHHIRDELFCGFNVFTKGAFLVYKATMSKALFDFLYVRKNIILDKKAAEELRLNIELLTNKEKKEVIYYAKKEGSEKMKKIVGYIFDFELRNAF